MTKQDIVKALPHDIKLKILETLKTATPDLSNPAFQFLWEAYFIYVDPDAVKNSNCPICLNNVLNSWSGTSEAIAQAVKEYNTFERL